MEKTRGHLTNEGAGAQEGNYILSSSPHSHTGYLAIAATSSMGREEWEAVKRLRRGPLSWWKLLQVGGLSAQHRRLLH